jgi:hypothetical protein
MFLFMTATCVILALLALGIKSPVHWLGVLIIPLICLGIIGSMEFFRIISAPPPMQRRIRLPPQNPLRDVGIGIGDNPFAPFPPAGDIPFGPAKAAEKSEAPPTEAP